MAQIIRFALLAVIAVLLLSLVAIGIGTGDTGVAEKAALVVIGVALVFAAYKVQTFSRQPHSA